METNKNQTSAMDSRLVDVLSEEDILEGNKLMLWFTGLDTGKPDKWIIECALFDRSWDELMKVSEKISKTYGDYSDGINGRTFNFKHMMFHEIIGNRNFLYRRCVEWLKHYRKVMCKPALDDQPPQRHHFVEREHTAGMIATVCQFCEYVEE